MTLAAARGAAGTTGGTQLAEFRARCARAVGRDLTDPVALHAFSVTEAPTFWRELLDWAQLPWSGSAEPVLVGEDVETARFFPGVVLNYAEALLRPLPGHEDAPALTAVHAGRPAETLTRRELRERVAASATALAGLGVGAGTRVVAVAPNTADVAVAVLAVAALGATVATATPDVGTPGLLDRFEQVEPTLLLLDRAGVAEPAGAELVAGLPTLRHVVLLDAAPPPASAVPVARLAELVAASAGAPRPDWPRLPFDHPLFVLFSSGTTGPPKAIVHGAGGTLLEHVKEHRLHGDLRAGETLYFHTTTAWMMWNWQLSALAVGAHVVVYDGPVEGPHTLWELVAEHGVDVFGTSPAYLQLCQDAGYRPGPTRLRSVLSTGAVLHDWQFDWLAGAVGPVPLQSISGGTDIIGCFVLGHPELPVPRGRCQTRSLGLDVAAVDEHGTELVDAVGELVCRAPFPSRPVGFLRDPDGSRFHRAYFAEHAGMWTHGDLVELDATGSARLHGRSDGVLNVNGIRIGPSEIYATLRGVPGIADAMAVEQRDPLRPGATRMVLLVVTAPGAVLDGELDRTIRRTLRTRNSVAHVPALVVAVPQLPTTHNGKRSERAARDAVNGDRVANETALRDPSCLAAIRAAVLATAPSPALAEPRETAADLGAVGRIWQSVLATPGVEPDDHFLELGGTSRAVVDLLRRVKVELGTDVAIGAFHADPTPRGLVRAVAAARAAVADAAPLLRHGTGPPVFLLADHIGQLNLFHGLAAALATERPVHGLVPPVVDDAGQRRSVAAIAADAVALLTAARAAEAPSLVGFSFGGLVAYEMACRLQTAGGRAAYVGLIDVLPPAAALTPGEARARLWANRLRMASDPAALREAVGWQLRLRRRAVDPEWEEFRRACTTFDAHRPGRYDGQVTYFLAAARTPLVGNQLAAWRRVAPNLLECPVPGRHDTVLGARAVATLAARISATLV